MAATGALMYGRLALPESSSVFRDLAFLAALTLLGIVTFVSVVVAWRAGTKVVAVLAPSLMLGAMAAGFTAEPLHWRWSQAEFARVATGMDVDCAQNAECRLGWWRVRGSERFDEMVIVWLADDNGCYAGRGLAMPLDGAPDADAVATSARTVDAPSDLVSASRWRDGWYELCFVT